MPALAAADRKSVSTSPAAPGLHPGDQPAFDARLGQVVDAMHEGVVVRDASGVITYANEAAVRILRRSREQLIGSTSVSSRSGVHADGTPFPANESAASIALATGGDVVEELVGMEMDDGERRWLSVSARALTEAGVVTGAVSTFVDVTEQQNTVVALAESERRFRLLAENASDLITSIDPDGMRTYVSPSCRALLGYEPEELIGKVAMDIIHPDDRRHIQAYLRTILEQRQASDEGRFLHKDGTWVWMESRGRAVLDAHGNVVELQTVARDITAQRQAARELREAEERFRNAFDQAPIGKALVAPEGPFMRVNATLCRLTGHSEQDLLATTFQELTHPDDLPADLEHVEMLLSGQTDAYSMEKRYRHADGSYLWILLSVSLVRDEGGAPLYFVAQIQDISEQKQTAERLEKLTLHDALTGLANRVLFADRLAHAVARSRRTKERIAVLFIDLDRFKSVNDSLGHAAGDELLRQAATRMRRAIRPADTIARLGGDEFTVLCEDLGTIDDAGWVANRLSDALERPFDLFGSETSIGVSIGIAVADAHDSAETVLAKADAAMYRVKNDRRRWQGAA
jgi:diguanylate cyclase (GGDEF)-like protein/PAS domain S-box-containing protein